MLYRTLTHTVSSASALPGRPEINSPGINRIAPADVLRQPSPPPAEPSFVRPAVRDGACIGYTSGTGLWYRRESFLARGPPAVRARPDGRKPLDRFADGPRLSALVYRPVCCSVRPPQTRGALSPSECGLARNRRLLIPVARPLFMLMRAVLLASFGKAVLWCMMPLRGLRMVPGRRVLG